MLEDKIRKGFFKNIKKNASCIVLASSLALASGCTVYHHRPETTFIRPFEEITSFDYEKTDVNPVKTLEETTRNYKMEKVQFPSFTKTHEQNDEVVAHYYTPKGNKKRAVIIVVPILGGNYFIEETFARKLANNDFAVLRFERKGKLFDKSQKDVLRYTTSVMKQTVIDIRRGIDWLEKQPEIDKDKIGIQGVSMGAIVSSVVAGVDSRIKAGSFMLGGGDIARILATTNEPGIVKEREEMLKKKNWTLEQFRENCRSYSEEVDPLTYARFIDPSKILMMNAYFDKVILMDHAEKLWKEMGKPDFEKLFCGHYTAILYLPYAKARTVEHFKEKLLGVKPSHNFENTIGY